LYFSADDGLAVERTDRARKTEAKAAEPQLYVRPTNISDSMRHSRSGQLHYSGSTQHMSTQSMLMQASLRMHRNPVFYSIPPVVRHRPMASVPIPSDWTTERSLTARRRPAATSCKEDSYITTTTSKLQHAPVDGELLNAVEKPESDVEDQPPAAAASNCLSSSTLPVPVRQVRKPRRRTLADAANNNSPVNDDAGRLPASADKESPLLDLSTAVPTNSARKETDVDSILSSTSAQQSSIPTATRRSLVFEKVQPVMVEPIVNNRCHITEQRFPVKESSV